MTKNSWFGWAQGFLGLSGAISVRVYDIICGGNPTNFILMLALLPTFITLLLLFLVRANEKTSTVDSKKHLNVFSAIALSIVAYRMIMIILQNIFTFPSWAHISSFLYWPLPLELQSEPGVTTLKGSLFQNGAKDVSEYEQLVPSSDDKVVLQNEERIESLASH